MLHHLHAAPYPDHSSFPRRARLLPVLVYVRPGCMPAGSRRPAAAFRERTVSSAGIGDDVLRVLVLHFFFTVARCALQLTVGSSTADGNSVRPAVVIDAEVPYCHIYHHPIDPGAIG
ncbi:hypothetical protein GUJ93_ZPchr0006g42727 [Zizania palustris]|uniref:Uncharacterized protein n=1 Tax=Zizania palustris TaxID=103762 RepID=A0A8J5TCP1_ZIZPA|nr:hypothetical protein GUJ93_ZPchr0006g42727 [Zizania palustris]